MKQYYMYGTIMSYDRYIEWKNKYSSTLDEFIRDIELNSDEIIVDDISCIFSVREDKYLVIGKKIREFDDSPIIIDKLKSDEENKIITSVGRNFKVFGGFNYFFIKTM